MHAYCHGSHHKLHICCRTEMEQVKRKESREMERLNKEDDTLIHISHRHPLHLTDLAGGDAAPPCCHACRFPCTGSFYQCAPCHYALHPSCARFARTIRHPSHPAHDLALRLTPAGENGCHLCRACRHIGYSWSFACAPCGFDLHLPCAALPGAAAAAPAHNPCHRLTLAYEDPRRGMGSFDFCAVCREGYSTARWFYACRECGVGAHVGCAVPDTPLAMREEYAALDKEQAAVAKAARWSEAVVPEPQQLKELLDEQVIALVRTELNAGGLLPLFAKACQD